MKYLDLSFQTPEENLACDEALLDDSEEGSNVEVLRLWESKKYFVVLGYSRKFRQETNWESCQKLNIPILRRPSGGGTVLQGPGCLNFSLILDIQNSKPLKTITDTNCYILNRHQTSLEPVVKKPIQILGISDLAIQNLKFSGNAQRRKKKFILYHGTFLLDFNIALMKELLPIPINQPTYREYRKHDQFLTNLNVPMKKMKDTLIQSWNANKKMELIPHKKMTQLIKERYSSDKWNFKY